MRQNTSRNPGRTQTDLDLERRGTMRDLGAEDRAAFIRVAQILGCDTAAQHIREDERRRERVHAAPAPTPRPGPKPRLTPARTPMLMVVPSSTSDIRSPAASADVMWTELADLASRWLRTPMPPSDVQMLAAIDQACADRSGRPARRLELVDD